MSTRVMAICWPLIGMSILQKSVLISLADQANDDGVCWPSVKTIYSRVCASERAVQEAIRWLVENGYMRRVCRLGKPTYYTLTPASAAPRSKRTPAVSADKPPQHLPVGGAGSADITVIEPNIEPSNILPIANKPKIEKLRKTQISDEFVLTDARRRKAIEYWAKKNRFDLIADDEFENFRNRHKSKGEVMLDWDSAWSTWYANAVKFNRPANTYTNNQPKTIAQTSNEIAARSERIAAHMKTNGGLI